MADKLTDVVCRYADDLYLARNWHDQDEYRKRFGQCANEVTGLVVQDMEAELTELREACNENAKERDALRTVAIRNAYPALRAYVAALEAERDASRALLAALDDGSTLVNTGPDRRVKVDRLYNSRLATDAAREKMEEQSPSEVFLTPGILRPTDAAREKMEKQDG